MYLANFECITSIGVNAEMTFSAIKAGLCGYKENSFLCANGEAAVTSHINDDLFLMFFLSNDYTGAYTNKMDRSTKCLLYAFNHLEEQTTFDEKLPLIWLSEEPHASREVLPFELIKEQLVTFETPVDPALIYKNAMGRAAGIAALQQANNLLHQAGHDYLLIGGVECPFHRPWLEYLDERQRLKSRGSKDAFVPGEAAALMLLARTPELAAQAGAKAMIKFALPAVTESPAHWYNETPDSGEALYMAMQEAIANARAENADSTLIFDHIGSSMNGESFWAKEYGVAAMRLKECFTEDVELLHPAEFTGDLGCVSGLFLMAQSAHLIQEGNSQGAIVYASSDNTWRSAVAILKASG